MYSPAVFCGGVMPRTHNWWYVEAEKKECGCFVSFCVIHACNCVFVCLCVCLRLYVQCVCARVCACASVCVCACACVRVCSYPRLVVRGGREEIGVRVPGPRKGVHE